MLLVCVGFLWCDFNYDQKCIQKTTRSNNKKRVTIDIVFYLLYLFFICCMFFIYIIFFLLFNWNIRSMSRYLYGIVSFIFCRIFFGNINEQDLETIPLWNVNHLKIAQECKNQCGNSVKTIYWFTRKEKFSCN